MIFISRQQPKFSIRFAYYVSSRACLGNVYTRILRNEESMSKYAPYNTKCRNSHIFYTT